MKLKRFSGWAGLLSALLFLDGCGAQPRPVPLDLSGNAAPDRPYLCRAYAGIHRIPAVAVSPDGRLGLTPGADDTVILWSMETREALETFRGHSKPVTAVCFSPDGKYAISGGEDGSIRRWIVETGKPLQILWPRIEATLHLAQSTDGKLLLSGGEKGLDLWDAERGKILQELQKVNVTAVAFSPNGNYFLAALLEKEGARISMREVATGEEVRSLPLETPVPVTTLEMGPEGRLLAAVREDGRVILWNVAEGKPVATFSAPAPGGTELWDAGNGRAAVWALYQEGVCESGDPEACGK